MHPRNRHVNNGPSIKVPLCNRLDDTVDTTVSELDKQVKFMQAFGGQYIPMGHNVSIKLTNHREHNRCSLPIGDNEDEVWLMNYGTSPVSTVIYNWNQLFLWLEHSFKENYTPDVLYVTLLQSDEIDLYELASALTCLNTPTTYILKLLEDFNNSTVAQDPMRLRVLHRRTPSKLEVGFARAESMMNMVEYQVQDVLCKKFHSLSVRMENAANYSLTGAALALNCNAVMLEADRFEVMPVNFLEDFREATVNKHGVDIQTGLCGTYPVKMIELQVEAKKRPNQNFIGRRLIQKHVHFNDNIIDISSVKTSSASLSKNPMGHIPPPSNSSINMTRLRERMYRTDSDGRIYYPMQHRSPSFETGLSSSVVETKKDLGCSNSDKRKTSSIWRSMDHKRRRGTLEGYHHPEGNSN